MNFLEKLLTGPHANSRFCYLLVTITVCLTVAFVAIRFTFVSQQTLYPEVLGVLLGGSFFSGVARFLNKKGSPNGEAEVKK